MYCAGAVRCCSALSLSFPQLLMTVTSYDVVGLTIDQIITNAERENMNSVVPTKEHGDVFKMELDMMLLRPQYEKLYVSTWQGCQRVFRETILTAFLVKKMGARQKYVYFFFV